MLRNAEPRSERLLATLKMICRRGVGALANMPVRRFNSSGAALRLVEEADYVNELAAIQDALGVLADNVDIMAAF